MDAKLPPLEQPKKMAAKVPPLEAEVRRQLDQCLKLILQEEVGAEVKLSDVFHEVKESASSSLAFPLLKGFRVKHVSDRVQAEKSDWIRIF